jgi:hypothetical protein
MCTNKRLFQLSKEYLSKDTVTLDAVAAILNQECYSCQWNRKKVSGKFILLGCPKKNKVLINKSKQKYQIVNFNRVELEFQEKIKAASQKSGLSLNDMTLLYQEDKSLNYLIKLTGLTQHLLTRIITEGGVKIRTPRHFTHVLKDFEEMGVTRESIESIYLGKNLNTKELACELASRNNIPISEKNIIKIIQHYKIEKPMELVRQKQGNGGRATRQANEDTLLRAGFTPQSLAQYYADNHSETYESIICNIQEVTHNQLTERWIEKTLSKQLQLLDGYQKPRSRTEENFSCWLSTVYPGAIERNNRKLISPQEIDFVLPERKIAIEFNGDYWHSDKFMLHNHGITAYEYHLRKKKNCRQEGISLYFVWENDWGKKREAVREAVDGLLEGGHCSKILKRLK